MHDARQGSSTCRRAGDCGADRKALRGKCCANGFHQCCFAAEQMRAAGDVKQQPMRRIECDQRRVAIAPVGDVAQEFGIGNSVIIDHFDIRTDSAGIGERQTHFESASGSDVI